VAELFDDDEVTIEATDVGKLPLTAPVPERRGVVPDGLEKEEAEAGALPIPFFFTMSANVPVVDPDPDEDDPQALVGAGGIAADVTCCCDPVTGVC